MNERAIRLVLDGYDAQGEALAPRWAQAMEQARVQGVAGWEWSATASDGTAQPPGVICAGCAAALGVRQAEFMLSRATPIHLTDRRVGSMRCAFEARHPAQSMVLPVATPSAKT